MNRGRVYHRSVLLKNNTVLTVGGMDGDNCNTCEIYNPETGQWNYTGSMNNTRTYDVIISLLKNGSVLALGGSQNFTSEIYNPETGTWIVTDSLNIGRCVHTATLLPNGKVLVAGGYNFTEYGSIPLNSCEIYDPKTNLWTNGHDMNFGRMNHTATLLNDGRVLAAGGAHPYANPATELYVWNYAPKAVVFAPSSGFVNDTLKISVQVTDPNSEDSVSCRLIFAPGDTSEWSEFSASGKTVVFKHCWQNDGNFQVKVQARDQWNLREVHNSLSEWISGPVVEIAIYDLNGRKIAVLFSGFQKAGKYSAVWEPQNVPSGMYLCCFNSPCTGFTCVKKLLFLK
ncbi:MAG: kelch repeat-containing protein [Candidatus Cloacimonadales bacterium]|nr:kelch repeat-containing protein [Candidatus Cloacimonadales bacterium]